MSPPKRALEVIKVGKEASLRCTKPKSKELGTTNIINKYENGNWKRERENQQNGTRKMENVQRDYYFHVVGFAWTRKLKLRCL